MSDDYSYKVRVNFADGGFVDFLSDNSFDTGADGRILFWQGVLLEHQTLEFYSVPVERIKDVREAYIGEEEE